MVNTLNGWCSVEFRQCRRSASRNGLIPVRRIKAMTISMRSAESISVKICEPTRGSPGALVSRVVSNNGIVGAARISREPSGLKARIEISSSPTSTGCSTLNSETAVSATILSIKERTSLTPTSTRSLSARSFNARSRTEPKCIANRSAASE